MSPKVSIIITAHNYAQYLERCLESAFEQTYSDYEIVVVDDGSTDETPEILRSAKARNPDQLRVIHLEGLGLPAACNAGIEAAVGDYIVRLDADDYFDENLLTVEANYLDTHSDVDLVFPDYYTVDNNGDILEHIRMMKVNDEVELLNRSPLAAGAMYRRSSWAQINGYDETLEYQEDYDFWVRFVDKFEVRNVNLPLMYYRQHGSNMSRNLSGRLEARRDVKRKFVSQNLASASANAEVLGIIPARSEQRVDIPDEAELREDPLALWSVGNRRLIEYTIDEALAADRLDRVIVSTDSEEIADVARETGGEVPRLRPTELTDRTVPLNEVISAELEELRAQNGYEPDFVVLLQYVSPLKTADHIDEVVDTWQMFAVDSVISVTKNNKFLWQPGTHGLEPLFDERLLREERETLYQEDGAIYGFDPSIVFEHDELIGEHVGHILMEQQRAIHIDSWFDLRMCEHILGSGGDRLVPAYDGVSLDHD